MASKAPATAAKSSHVVKKEMSANNFIAAVAGVTVVVILVCGFIGNMLLGTLITNTKVITGKQQASKDLDTKLQDIPTLIDNYKGLGYRQQLISDGMPTTADFPQIVSIMQTMSSSSGVELKSVTPPSDSSAPTSGPTAAAAGLHDYTFSVSVAGSYPKIVSFFKSLEQSVRPMRVASSQFKGDSGNVAVDMQIQTYYQDEATVDDKMEVVK